MGHQTAALGQQMGQIPQMTGPPPSTITGVNPFSKLGRKKPAAKTANHEFKCEYCQVFLNSQKQLEQHNSSPKHITTKNSINKQMGQSSRNRGDEKFIMHKMRWKISPSPKKKPNLCHHPTADSIWHTSSGNSPYDYGQTTFWQVSKVQFYAFYHFFTEFTLKIRELRGYSIQPSLD